MDTRNGAFEIFDFSVDIYFPCMSSRLESDSTQTSSTGKWQIWALSIFKCMQNSPEMHGGKSDDAGGALTARDTLRECLVP